MSEVSSLSNFALKHILRKKTGCKLKRYRTNKQTNKTFRLGNHYSLVDYCVLLTHKKIRKIILKIKNTYINYQMMEVFLRLFENKHILDPVYMEWGTPV